MHYPQAPYYIQGGTQHMAGYYSQAIPQGPAPYGTFQSGQSVALGQLPTASAEFQIGAGFGSGGGALGAAAAALLVSAFWRGGAQKRLTATQWTLGLIAAASVAGFGFGVKRKSEWEAGVTSAL